MAAFRCVKGDLLWVRKTVARGASAPSRPSYWAPAFWRREQGTPANPNGLWYALDGLAPEKLITERGRWVPSIHLPRRASRLTLTVTDVRVQRLQDISERDATDKDHIPARQKWGGDPVDAFRGLWREINGHAAWAANPWVCAPTFTVERRNTNAGEPAMTAGQQPERRLHC